MENKSKSSDWMDKVNNFFDELPSSSEPEQEIKIDGVLIPRSLITRGEVYASELSNELLDVLVKKFASFTLQAVSDQSEMVRRLEQHIEARGMTCRIYTENRGGCGRGAALVTGVGVAAVVAIAAHNIATWDPDYEIAKNFVEKKISVNFKK